jgi:hypothetical protein
MFDEMYLYRERENENVFCIITTAIYVRRDVPVNVHINSIERVLYIYCYTRCAVLF